MDDFVKCIKEFCDDQEDLNFYKDYSGRFMYGRRCIGISSNNIYKTMIDLTEYLCEKDFDYISDTLGEICSDNMGLDMIVYFPRLSWDE